MIFLFHCEKAIHDTGDCGLVFFIVDVSFYSRCAVCICGLNIYQTLRNHIQNI